MLSRVAESVYWMSRQIERAVNDSIGPITLGFRAEDASLTEPGSGQIEAPIYTLELLVDATMITVRAGGALISVKSGKEFRDAIGNAAAISIPPEICHLFDTATGTRIGA